MENNINKIYFVSGVNGIGKTTIIPHLKTLLALDKYKVHDFDERGIPAKADTNWRISETKYWVDQGVEMAKLNISIIVCGFVKLKDFQDLLCDKSLNLFFIFLDARPEIISQRLMKRYSDGGFFDKTQTVIGKPIDEFINGNIYISGQMKKTFLEFNYPVIDTSDLTPKMVAERVVKFILK